MSKRYLFIAAIGFVLDLAVLIWGQVGMVVMALMALSPWIERGYKPDEREYQLFYKANNLTLGALVVVLVLLDQLSGPAGAQSRSGRILDAALDWQHALFSWAL